MHAVMKPDGWDPSTNRLWYWPKGGTVTIHPVLAAARPRPSGENVVIGPGSSVQLSSIRTPYCYALNTAPSGTRPVVRKRHNATISLRARATIVIRLIRLLALAARWLNHLLSALSG